MKGKFQYDLCEYLLVVNLPNRVSWDVEDIKRGYAASHGNFHGLDAVPYVSVLNLILHRSQEQEIIERLEKQLNRIDSFDVSLNGFGFHDTGNAFHINVDSRGAIETIHNFLMADLHVKRVLMSPANRSFNPHLPLAKKLTDAQFRNAYHEYRNQEYTNFFRVESLTLLKRRGPLANWSFFADLSLKEEIGCVV